MDLITAETFHANPAHFGMGDDIPVPGWTLVWHSAKFKPHRLLNRPVGVDDLPKKARKNPVVEVYVTDGRWCAPCPWCPAASEYPSITDTRFICSQCHNNDTYAWISVKWPKPQDVETIDQILMMRGRHQDRNWFPNESLQDLAAENELHGIPTFTALGLNPPKGFISPLGGR